MRTPLHRTTTGTGMAALGTILTVSATALAAALAQNGTPLGQQGDWTIFSDPAKTVCFVASQAKDSEPKGLNRDAVVFYVSTWPKEGVKGEVSIKLGYKAKKGSEATLSVGKDSFKLFSKDDKVFVDDPTRELKALEALKKSSKATVSATSERGTATTDTFSLNGLAQALQTMASACP